MPVVAAHYSEHCHHHHHRQLAAIPSIYDQYLQVNRNIVKKWEIKMNGRRKIYLVTRERSMHRVQKKMKGWWGPRETAVTQH
jgi:hypothetical protein